MAHRPLLLRGGYAASAALLALTAGCGSKGSADTTPSAGTTSATASGSVAPGTLLTTDQALSAALTADDVGPGWTQGRFQSNDSTPFKGTCLAGLDTGDNTPTDTGTSFDFGPHQIPSLQSEVMSWDDETTPSKDMATFRSTLAACNHASVAMSSNLTWDFDVSSSDGTKPSGVDDVLEVEFTGTLTAKSDGSSTPLNAHYSIVRIGNDVTQTSYVAVDDPTSLATSYEQIAIARLQALLNGTTPTPTTAPSPTKAL